MYDHWSREEVVQTFGDPNANLKHGMRALLSLFYVALGRDEFERLVARAVRAAKHDYTQYDVFEVDCTVVVHQKQEAADVECLRWKLRERPDSLSAHEIGVLVLEGEVTPAQVRDRVGR